MAQMDPNFPQKVQGAVSALEVLLDFLKPYARSSSPQPAPSFPLPRTPGPLPTTPSPFQRTPVIDQPSVSGPIAPVQDVVTGLEPKPMEMPGLPFNFREENEPEDARMVEYEESAMVQQQHAPIDKCSKIQGQALEFERANQSCNQKLRELQMLTQQLKAQVAQVPHLTAEKNQCSENLARMQQHGRGMQAQLAKEQRKTQFQMDENQKLVQKILGTNTRFREVSRRFNECQAARARADANPPEMQNAEAQALKAKINQLEADLVQKDREVESEQLIADAEKDNAESSKRMADINARQNTELKQQIEALEKKIKDLQKSSILESG
jgi:hypothetical protein